MLYIRSIQTPRPAKKFNLVKIYSRYSITL